MTNNVSTQLKMQAMCVNDDDDISAVPHFRGT